MYKDKEESNKAAKERMKKMRERRNTEGVTSKGVTKSIIPWYSNKPTDDQGQPIKPVTLSDGQKWYPNPLSVFTHRIEKKRTNIECANGAYIDVNKLVDLKWRKLLTYLVENLKPAYQDSIRVGMSGPSVRECKELLEVTA